MRIRVKKGKNNQKLNKLLKLNWKHWEHNLKKNLTVTLCSCIEDSKVILFKDIVD